MTAFWCSRCKVSHAGDCPPAPEQVTIIDDGEDGDIDFDCLVDAYMELPQDEVQQHYLAAKKALVAKLYPGQTLPPDP